LNFVENQGGFIALQEKMGVIFCAVVVTVQTELQTLDVWKDMPDHGCFSYLPCTRNHDHTHALKKQLKVVFNYASPVFHALIISICTPNYQAFLKWLM
jgi:hypothetical protein